MAYLSFYRKWRPQRFGDVAGQKHVTRTLQNALEMDRLGHAYLFCGPRGTGKTTIAKILAKAVNCEKGPASEPCDECTSCAQIREGRSLDVIEIDGASNRGIDEIRDLREKVKFSPAKARFKVYIIDEVHMLTTEAFNALLKTLEEPPPHVIFVFATTEPQKVPSTILSRCQRFDFKRLTHAEIVDYLGAICTAEGIQAQAGVLPLLARLAEGGMRDALSLLDQLVSYAGKNPAVSDVRDLLGIADDELLEKFVELTKKRDSTGLILFIEELAQEGRDVAQFAHDVVLYLRDLLLVSAGADGARTTAGLSDEEWEARRRLAGGFTADELIDLIRILSPVEGEIRRTAHSRLPFELAVLRISVGDKPVTPTNAVAPQAQAGAVLRRSVETGGITYPAAAPPAADKAGTAATEAEDGAIRATPAAATASTDASSLVREWQKVLETLREGKLATLQVRLNDGSLVEVNDHEVWVEFPRERSFHHHYFQTDKNACAQVEAVLQQVFGRPLALRVALAGERAKAETIRNGADTPGGDVRNPSALPKQEERRNAKDEGKDDPLVKAAYEVFGADLVEIK